MGYRWMLCHVKRDELPFEVWREEEEEVLLEDFGPMTIYAGELIAKFQHVSDAEKFLRMLGVDYEEGEEI